MKKTALFLFMLFAFVMKAQETQETQETFYIGERSSIIGKSKCLKWQNEMSKKF